MTRRKAKAIYQLRVTLRHIQPAVWRSVQLPEDTKLSRLHRILQASSGSVCTAFRTRRRTQPCCRSGRGTFEYVYDFGDGWRHEILLEAILLPSPDVFYPRCVAGARNGPPEDAGGPWRYADYLDALADPENDRHEEFMRWRGPFDPEDFSLEAINASRERTFRRRAAAKRTG